MVLQEIDVPYKIHGNTEAEISSLSMSSNDIKDGSCFFALRGTKTDGHDFIQDAIQNGASVIVCENDRIESFDGSITYVAVADVSEIMGLMADIFFGHPSRFMKVIGVTGTNGKTTVATMIYRMLMGFHRKVGLVSTNGDLINGEPIESSRTTPTTPYSISLQSLLAKMKSAGCEYVVMEVSSHSTVQNRIKGVQFAGGIFTNLSHDHLDFHHTIENYAAAKKLFFDFLPETAFALTNTDDEYGRYMVKDTLAKVYTYGFNNIADFSEIIESRLVGQFNQYNMLAVYATGTLIHFENQNIKKVLETLDAPAGRFELVVDKNNIRAIVDYAHTPDGVENVLVAARNILKQDGRIITIIGCGGDRDSSKRPVMARLAYDMSDCIILTSDNPRTEDPDKILHEMKAGLPELAESDKTNSDNQVEVISDRHLAILRAKEISRSGDIIMVLGKGHENYQEINGVQHHFDDKEELLAAFS